jgi:uncharacterized cupin superfamily protein
MSDYTVVQRDEALDFMAEYPGYGQMLSYTGALGAEDVAMTWRRMPPGTGGKGSYGHRHASQEEIYLVLAGEVTFKVGDDVFTAGPNTAVRVATDAYRSVHNDGEVDADLVICSVRRDDAMAETDTQEGFWPE